MELTLANSDFEYFLRNILTFLIFVSLTKKGVVQSL